MENKKELQRLGSYTQALVEIKDWCEKVNKDNNAFVERNGVETHFDSKKAFLCHRMNESIDNVLHDLTAIGELYD